MSSWTYWNEKTAANIIDSLSTQWLDFNNNFNWQIKLFLSQSSSIDMSSNLKPYGLPFNSNGAKIWFNFICVNSFIEAIHCATGNVINSLIRSWWWYYNCCSFLFFADPYILANWKGKKKIIPVTLYGEYEWRKVALLGWNSQYLRTVRTHKPLVLILWNSPARLWTRSCMS